MFKEPINLIITETTKPISTHGESTIKRKIIREFTPVVDDRTKAKEKKKEEKTALNATTSSIEKQQDAPKGRLFFLQSSPLG